MIKSNKGFTLLELIIVIVCIGILVSITLPKFFTIAQNSTTSAEDDVVGSVRTGIQLYRAEGMVQTGTQSYPSALDSASVGQSSVSNSFFDNILQEPYKGDDWQKTGANDYTGPAGGTYTYDSSSGQFNKTN